MKDKKKQKADMKRTPRAEPLPASGGGSTKLVLLLLGTFLLVFGGVWAFCEFVLWNKIPAELVGKWVVLRGPDEGGTIDFYRGGSMVAKVNQGGYEGTIGATIRVEENRIHVTTKNQKTGEVGTRVQTIKSLDRSRLVLQDERGVSIELERANSSP